jgi:hypothetical protein
VMEIIARIDDQGGSPGALDAPAIAARIKHSGSKSVRPRATP